MPYELDSRLVVGVASSALFDLAAADKVFRTEGVDAYRKYQEENIEVPLNPGVAFSFIRRLLSLNDLSDDPIQDPLIEVIVLSRNDPDTGLRVMESIAHHGLPISRAVFMEGKAPFAFIPAFNISLFLSSNEENVREAVDAGLPAGLVLDSATVDDPEDADLRIAFDFDGVLADDESEQVMQSGDLTKFHAHEREKVVSAHDPGPLLPFLTNLGKVQERERERVRAKESNMDYRIRLHVAVVTARNAPSHKRAINSLKEWGVTVNDAFFLGGIDKGKVIAVLRPHIFFDDQRTHLDSTAAFAPSVHVPFGAINHPAPEVKAAKKIVSTLDDNGAEPEASEAVGSASHVTD